MSLIYDQSHSFSTHPPVVSAFFREEFYGYYEGADVDKTWYLSGAPHGTPTFKDILNKYDMNHAKDFLKAADPFHLAENATEYWKRLNQGLQLITANNQLVDGDNVLLVSHGNTLLSLVDRFSEPGQFDVSQRPANGSITKIAVDGTQLHVISYNQ